MAAYPPPPGSPFDPSSRAALRAQAQLWRNQRRIQRAQWRAQRRAQRRGSLVGPLLLLALGAAFLLVELGRLSWVQSLVWYGRWWPAVLIVAGLVLLLEWALDQHRPAVNGTPPVVRTLGGGVVLLLILLVFAGLAARGIAFGLDWQGGRFGHGYANLDRIFGDRHDAYSAVSSSIPPGAPLVVRNPHGDITVTGVSTDGQVHVSVHTQAYAWKDSDVDTKARALTPVFSQEAGDLVLSVTQVEGGSADLTIELPRNSPLTVQADRGDVTISQIHGALTLSANHGDVNLSDIVGVINARVNDDNASFTAQGLTGDLQIDGRGGDADISDVTGAVSMRGDFFGTTHLSHIRGVVLFETSRTHFQAARVDGEFEVEGGQDLQASDVLGPVAVSTRNRNIELDRIEGSVQVTDKNGSVHLTTAPPLAPIQVQDEHGSVDVALPAAAGFVLNGTTRNGDVENDFDLSTAQNEDAHVLRGTVHGGGPTVSLSTSDGDLTVRKSSLESLPAALPAPLPATLKPASPGPSRAPAPPAKPTPPVAVTGVF